MKKRTLLYIILYLITCSLFDFLLVRHAYDYFDLGHSMYVTFMAVSLLFLTYVLYILLYFKIQKADIPTIIVLPFGILIVSLFTSRYLVKFIKPLELWHIIISYTSIYCVICILAGMRLFKLFGKTR